MYICISIELNRPLFGWVDFPFHGLRSEVFFLMVLLLGLVYIFALFFTQLLDGKNQPPGVLALQSDESLDAKKKFDPNRKDRAVGHVT